MWEKPLHSRGGANQYAKHSLGVLAHNVHRRILSSDVDQTLTFLSIELLG